MVEGPSGCAISSSCTGVSFVFLARTPPAWILAFLAAVCLSFKPNRKSFHKWFCNDSFSVGSSVSPIRFRNSLWAKGSLVALRCFLDVVSLYGSVKPLRKMRLVTKEDWFSSCKVPDACIFATASPCTDIVLPLESEMPEPPMSKQKRDLRGRTPTDMKRPFFEDGWRPRRREPKVPEQGSGPREGYG